jgi:serine/threonine-protein kinase
VSPGVVSTVPFRSTYPRRFGPYVLIEALEDDPLDQVSLGFGGDLGMEVLCVVHHLPRHLSEDPELLQRFRDKIATARRLCHGNLVATHAVGQVDREAFIAQEFVEGRSLLDVVARCQAEQARLPMELGPYIVGQAARGLAYAHDFEGLELAHGDVTPSKIRLSYAGEVKVVGFGLTGAKAVTPSAAADERRRALARYRAPEAVAGRDGGDRRADLYALGVLLWELVTGRRFVPGESPELPSRVESGVSHQLDWVVSKAIARGPEQRFQSADELRLTLAECLPAGRNLERSLADLLARLYDVPQERAQRQALVTAGGTVRLRRNTGQNALSPARPPGVAAPAVPTAAMAPPVLGAAAVAGDERTPSAGALTPVSAAPEEPGPARPARRGHTRAERYRRRVVASAAFAVFTLVTMIAVIMALRYASEHPAVADEMLGGKPRPVADAAVAPSAPSAAQAPSAGHE